MSEKSFSSYSSSSESDEDILITNNLKKEQKKKMLLGKLELILFSLLNQYNFQSLVMTK